MQFKFASPYDWWSWVQFHRLTGQLYIFSCEVLILIIYLPLKNPFYLEIVLDSQKSCRYSREFAQAHAYWVGNAIQPSYLLSHLSPPALNLSQNQSLFQWVGSSHQVAKILEHKYWSFGISPSNEYSGLISFRLDWFDLLAVWGILKSLLQHHNSKASILILHNIIKPKHIKTRKLTLVLNC